MQLQFKDYLLNENKLFLLNENQAYLGEKVSDILNAIQDLEENGKGLGVRHLVKNAEQIVNQIRRILHSHWTEKEEDQLKVLQKVGVAIMKGIDEKEDLTVILPSAAEEIEKMLGKLGMPANQLGSPKDAEQPAESSEEAQEESGVAPPQQKD